MATQTKPARIPFTSAQKKILVTLACVVGLRMLGLFLVSPVFTLYGLQFTRSRFLVGFAFGSYGLTMALLQIPFGRISDRIGRRRVLVIGMGLFSLGSFICAVPGWFPAGARIGILIAGRLIQGGGAIVSVAFATVADHIPEQRRSTAMAALGIPIGAAFIIGIVGGPALAGWLGTASLFWLTGFLGLGAVWLLARYLPEVPPHPEPPAQIGQLLKSARLLWLDGGGFIMNFFMTTFFFYFPLIATAQHHLGMADYYELLLPMVFISGVTMLIFTRGADHGWSKPLAAIAFLAFIPSAILLFQPAVLGFDPAHLVAVMIGGTLFFVGFTGLEPILPSMVSSSCPRNAYGTALGIYNSSQFLGSFVGGSAAGALAHWLTPHATMTVLLVTSIAGFFMMLGAHGGPARQRHAA
jgi:MFS family permease